MSREIRVFAFSLVVWLFSVTGAGGKLTTRPVNNVLTDVPATFHCTSDTKMPEWKAQAYSNLNRIIPVTEGDCEAARVDTYTAEKSGPTSCNLIFTYRYPLDAGKLICSDGTGEAIGILMSFESLRCGVLDNQFACEMESSVHKNVTPVDPYLSSLIRWKDDSGNVVAQNYSNFQDRYTLVSAEIPISISKDRPYVCSVEFKMVGDLTSEYSPVVNTGPIHGLRCVYPRTEAQQLEAQEAAKNASAAAAEAKERAANATGNAAKRERDVIDAIAMLMSLVAAFLVY